MNPTTLPLEYLVAEFVNLWLQEDGNVIMDATNAPRPLFLRQDNIGLYIDDPTMGNVFPLTTDFLTSHNLNVLI